jgi:hypothetical protein
MRPSKCTTTELLEVYANLILKFAQSKNAPIQTKNGVIETFFKFAAQVDDTLQNQIVIARTIRTMAMNTDIIPTLIRCGAVEILKTYASSMYNSRQLDTIIAWGCFNLAKTSEGRFFLNNNGKLVFLSRCSGRLVLEKRDPSTLVSLEPVKDLGECSPETKIDIVSKTVFLVSNVEYGISEEVIVVRTNGDKVFIPLNGCNLGGLNVCLNNDCAILSIQLMPGSNPDKHSCQARLKNEMVPCSGSGLFYLDPSKVIPSMAGPK